MSTILLVVLISVAPFLLSCNQDKVTSTGTEVTAKMYFQDGDTLSKTADTIVIKDGQSADTLVKYRPVAFSDFSVSSREIKFDKKLDFSRYEFERKYITVTRNAVRENGTNFAGHYCFVFWGCGSPCKLSAVVDLKTGKVFSGLPSGTGYSFRKDSRLLIVNPPDSTNWYNITIPYAIPEEYEWTGREFKRIKTSS